MQEGIKELLSSTHGLLAVLLITGATVLTAIGVLPVDDWKSYTQVIFVATAGAHAVLGAADSFANRSSAAANAAANPLTAAIKSVQDSSSPQASATVSATVTKDNTNA